MTLEAAAGLEMSFCRTGLWFTLPMVGYTSGYSPARSGFFVFPADPEDNNEKVFVVTEATSAVAFV